MYASSPSQARRFSRKLIFADHSASHYVRHLSRAPSSASHPASPLVHHRRPRTLAPHVVSRLHADRALLPGGLLDHFDRRNYR
uniref:Uncharacterized protein n=1 Tax=Caenorhabditis japonica TaxID=281687 RepID=A0A8R1IWK0_CAEJA